MLVVGATGVASELCKNIVLVRAASIILSFPPSGYQCEAPVFVVLGLLTPFLPSLSPSYPSSSTSSCSCAPRHFATQRPSLPGLTRRRVRVPACVGRPHPADPLTAPTHRCRPAAATQAGINSLTLLDHRTVTEAELSGQLLLGAGDVGANRAEASVAGLQRLNPNVEVLADTAEVAGLPDAYFSQFLIVVVTALPMYAQARINGICHAAGVKFFGSEVLGYTGYFFTDLVQHTFSEELVEVPGPDAKGEQTKRTVQGTLTFVPMSTAFEKTFDPKLSAKRLKRKEPALGKYLALRILDRFRQENGGRLPADPDGAGGTEDQAALDKIKVAVCKSAMVAPEKLAGFDGQLVELAASARGCELSPVAAVVGGVLAGELIKAMSLSKRPLDNFFVFDGTVMAGRVVRLVPVESAC